MAKLEESVHHGWEPSHLPPDLCLERSASTNPFSKVALLISGVEDQSHPKNLAVILELWRRDLGWLLLELQLRRYSQALIPLP